MADTLTPDNPTTLDDGTLAGAVATLSAHIHAATHRLLVLIAEFDRREVWAAQGAMSCAHWLGWACGIDTHTAREKVRVAHALEHLPLLSESMSKGELGYSKVRALTRIANPDNEADLLGIALHGTAAHVETFVRHYRRAVREEDTERAQTQHDARTLSCWYEDDGTFVLHGRFPAEMGARIASAIDAAIEAHEEEQPAAAWTGEVAPTYPQDVPDERSRSRPPRGVRRADALAWLCERLLDGGEAPELAPHRHEIVVHVDAAVLTHAAAGLADLAEGRCHVEDGAALAAETARRLCCDAGIVPVVDGPDGEPLAIGRRTRSIPPAMRRALRSRDGGCRFPACTSTHRLHGHHVQHWADGGETAMTNLVLLCPYHHRLVHEGGFDVVRLDDGAFRFTSPHGWTVTPPSPATPPTPETVANDNTRRGLDIGDDTAVARHTGERFDYDQGLMAMLARYGQPPRASDAADRTGPPNGPP